MLEMSSIAVTKMQVKGEFNGGKGRLNEEEERGREREG